MSTNSPCYLCGAGDDLRACDRCKHFVCQSCARDWRDWGSNTVRHTAATCRPCFDADLRRAVREGRALAGDVEMAPSFEELGCWH
jgi:hypothetical protein